MARLLAVAEDVEHCLHCAARVATAVELVAGGVATAAAAEVVGKLLTAVQRCEHLTSRRLRSVPVEREPGYVPPALAEYRRQLAELGAQA